jgi:hypothetical protein
MGWRDETAHNFARDFQYGTENLQLALIELVPSCERNEIHKGGCRTIAILGPERPSFVICRPRFSQGLHEQIAFGERRTTATKVCGV